MWAGCVHAVGLGRLRVGVGWGWGRGWGGVGVGMGSGMGLVEAWVGAWGGARACLLVRRGEDEKRDQAVDTMLGAGKESVLDGEGAHLDMTDMARRIHWRRRQ